MQQLHKLVSVLTSWRNFFRKKLILGHLCPLRPSHCCVFVKSAILVWASKIHNVFVFNLVLKQEEYESRTAAVDGALFGLSPLF